MYKIWVNEEKKRLYITMKGKIELHTADDMIKQIENEITKLKPQFDVISDISQFDYTSSLGGKNILHMQKLIRNEGVFRFVRIVGNQVASRMFFEGIARDSGIAFETAESMEEAERLLDQ